MYCILYVLSALITAAPLCDAASSFYGTSEATQCSNFTVTWSEGVSPYEIDLVPLYAVGTTTTSGVIIANTSMTSFSTLLPYPSGSSFIIMVSDATGFGSLAVSNAITVQDNTDSSCLPTSPEGRNFTVNVTPFPPLQCESLQFQLEDAFSLPLSIRGIIPGGDVWEMVSPLSIEDDWPQGWSTKSVNWTVDVPEGTQVVFLIGDGTGRAAGGWTALGMVGSSFDSSCLSSGAYTSTGALPATATSATAPASSASPDNTGSIVGVS